MCPALCAIIALYASDSTATTPMYVAIVVFGCAVIMMRSCMDVFECVITTVFVCTFEDKANYGSRYMSKHPQLVKVFGAVDKFTKDKQAADSSSAELRA